MKIYRTTAYRGDIPWSERLCTSRRQWAQLKKDFGYFGITRMKLERFEIPEHLWVLDQELPEQIQGPFSVDEGEVPEPMVMTTQGPMPISEASEIIRERILRQMGRNPRTMGLPGKTEEK